MRSRTATGLRLLGAVELLGAAGERIDAGPPQQRCLLAVMAMSPGRAVPMDDLIDRLWSRDVPQNVREVVYTYVSRLRHRFRLAGAPAALRRGNGGYLLDLPAGQVDLHRSRALVSRARQEDAGTAAELLREADGLWQGTPLAGLHGDWADRTRSALLQEHVTLIADRFGAELRLGRHAEVLDELLAAVAAHPLAEPLTAHLMLALYRAERQSEALAAYDAVRGRLVAELGEDPGPGLRDLHGRILRRDPDLDPPSAPPRPDGPARPARHADASAPVRPAQLPLAVPGFVGRVDVLAQLDTLLPEAAHRAPVAVVTGTAGVGKTTLAVHWAHRRADAFPDGQLYADLRGFAPEGGAVEPEQALRGFLAALGHRAEQLPPDAAGLSTLFRSVLSGRRVLIVLDNAGDAEQIRPLLPAAPGCLTLVTSRRELSGLAAAGAAQLRLPLFDPDEARQLLGERLGTDRLTADAAAVAAIVDRCAGLPLALAVVAVRAAARPGFGLDVLAAELRREVHDLAAFSGGDDGTDLRRIFSWSYRGLTPAAARLFRLAGLHPGPDLGPGAAAALAAVAQPRARELVAELTRANLLTEHAPGRYGMHDLLSDYAAELAGERDAEPERRAALLRLLDYYLHSADAACRAMWAGRDRPDGLGPAAPYTAPERFGDAARARAWFGAERRALTEAVRHAARAGLPDAAVRLGQRLANYLDREGHWGEQARLQAVVVRAARRAGNDARLSRALCNQARADFRLGRIASAHDRLDEARGLFRGNGDLVGQADVHNFLANIHEAQGQLDLALDHTRRALALYRSAGDRRGQGRQLNALGWLHSLRGEHEPALVHCRAALALQEATDDRYGAAITWNSLGRAHHRLGDPREAVDCYRRALALLESPEAADPLNTAQTLTTLGDAQHSAGDGAGARASWERAMRVYAKLHHPSAEKLRARLRRSPGQG